jgi:hypothetical protein
LYEVGRLNHSSPLDPKRSIVLKLGTAAGRIRFPSPIGKNAGYANLCTQKEMTPEARLDRLERIAMLFARAGDRARKQFREQHRDHDYKINHLIDLQIKNEEKFASNEERFAKLAESQANTDRRLNSLIDIIREGRKGDGTTLDSSSQ